MYLKSSASFLLAPNWVQHTNTSSMSGGLTTSLFYRDLGEMAHDEEQEGHLAVKQKPAYALKNTHLWVVAPRLKFVV